MRQRQWVLHRDPANKYGGTVTLGERPLAVPADAIISATRSEGFSVGRLILNSLLNQFIQRQLLKMPGLWYAELTADMKERYAQTMLIWSGRELTAFNRSGAHAFARRFFGWVLLGGKVRHYSLHWPANGQIPTESAVREILYQHGKLYVGGELVRKPSRVREEVV
jgi:hypothetical protein